jgi:hypothetical protein
MRLKSLVLIGMCTLRLGLTNEVPPFAGECGPVDRVFDVAGGGSPVRGTALRILELVALGRMESADVRLEAQVGLEPGALHGSAFRSPIVRMRALFRIGGVDLPEALEFLQGLGREDLRPDDSGMVWPTAIVALHQARLMRISGEAAKIAYLEDTLSEWSAASAWAAGELCDRGSYSSLPLIRKSVHTRNPIEKDAAVEIGYCEQRISLLSRNQDRIAALGSYLSVNEPSIDRRLTMWAVNQLYSMKSARADAELGRFAAELNSLPPAATDSQRGRDLLQTREELGEMLARRRK